METSLHRFDRYTQRDTFIHQVLFEELTAQGKAVKLRLNDYQNREAQRIGMIKMIVGSLYLPNEEQRDRVMEDIHGQATRKGFSEEDFRQGRQKAELLKAAWDQRQRASKLKVAAGF